MAGFTAPLRAQQQKQRQQPAEEAVTETAEVADVEAETKGVTEESQQGSENAAEPQAEQQPEGEAAPTILKAPEDQVDELNENYGGERVCPRCGWDTTEDAIQIDDEDKKAYIRSLLGNKRYTKEFSLFDGAIKITMQARTVAEMDMVFDQILADTDNNKIKSVESQNIVRCRYSMCFSVLEISSDTERVVFEPLTVPEPYTPPTVRAESVLVKEWHRFDGLSEQIFSALMHTYRKFDAELDVLIQRAMDPDFWTGAGRS